MSTRTGGEGGGPCTGCRWFYDRDRSRSMCRVCLDADRYDLDPLWAATFGAAFARLYLDDRGEAPVIWLATIKRLAEQCADASMRS